METKEGALAESFNFLSTGIQDTDVSHALI